MANKNDITANPAPLGLLGFGMTTVLLNIHNAGFIAFDTMILAMGIFYGGGAQFVAGIMEWKKGNTFGTTAFLSYGSFWFTLVALLVIPNLGWGFMEPQSGAMGAYFLMWGLFTTIMFIATLRKGRGLQVVFGTLFVLFFILASAEFTGSSALSTLAGYEGIICGFSAIYVGLAQVLNEEYTEAEVTV